MARLELRLDRLEQRMGTKPGPRATRSAAQRTESGPEISSAMGAEWTTRLL